MQKRIAVISGASGYLGFEVAKMLARDGLCIAMLYLAKTEKEISFMLEALEGDGHRAFLCDITDESATKEIIEVIDREMGSIFACVHAAGAKPQRKNLLSVTLGELEEAFRVNTLGGFNFLLSCARVLQSHKQGVIVGITTVGVVIPEATHSLGGYIPAKYALQGILAMLKEELKGSGVAVYSVAPGFMEGGMNSDIPKAFVEIFRRKSKTQTLTTPEDVARKISHLCGSGTNANDTLTHVVAKEYEEK